MTSVNETCIIYISLNSSIFGFGTVRIVVLLIPQGQKEKPKSSVIYPVTYMKENYKVLNSSLLVINTS